jgi:fumarate hydratase subunit alpha
MKSLRSIRSETVFQTIKQMIFEANIFLPSSVQKRILALEGAETSFRSRFSLSVIQKNAQKASQKKIPLCQDTGTAVFFAEIGHQVSLDEPIFCTIKRAVEEAYVEYSFRASIVKDPLFHRKNTGNNTPPVVHTEQVSGDSLTLFCLPKGGGAENKSIVKMLRPAAGKSGVIETVLDAAEKAGGASCPPWILGIGIGGTFDSVAMLAKKALFRPLGSQNKNEHYSLLEQEITEKIEALGIGTMGFGGEKTILGVHIESAPTHIASLPVAVNFQCHSARSAKRVL